MKFLIFSLMMTASLWAQAKAGFNPIIAYGTKVAVGGESWKSVVSIFSESGGCTGVIIDAQTVLTAGHCKPSGTVVIYNYYGSELYDSKTYEAGSYRWATHPQYSFYGADYDMGVLVVSEVPWSMEYTTTVNVLTQDDDGSSVRYGGSVVHVGAGINATESKNDASLYFTYGKIEGFTSESVTTRSTGGRVCRGDSGGPVFVRSRGELRLIGLHSSVQMTGANCGNVVNSTFLTASKYEWYTAKAEELKAGL